MTSRNDAATPVYVSEKERNFILRIETGGFSLFIWLVGILCEYLSVSVKDVWLIRQVRSQFLFIKSYISMSILLHGGFFPFGISFHLNNITENMPASS